MRAIYEPTGAAKEYGDYAVNTYTSCVGGCAYCYAPATRRMSREAFHKEARPARDILRRLEKDLSERKFDSQIFLCFLGDPYPPVEAELKITRRALELIKTSGNNFRVLTKNGRAAMRDFDLYGQGDEFGVTLTFISDEKRAIWEPNADATYFRMVALGQAKELGIYTWASLEPVIEPAETFALLLWLNGVDMVKVGKWNHDKRAEAIDWAWFAKEVRHRLDGMACHYVLKADLAAYLPEADHA